MQGKQKFSFEPGIKGRNPSGQIGWQKNEYCFTRAADKE